MRTQLRTPRTDFGLRGENRRAFALDLRMRAKLRTHQALAELAASQYGVVSHAQLTDLGYAATAVKSAVASGRLHRIHRGVFAVGHAGVSRHGRCLAGVLARGEGALLSYRSAAWLWGMVTAFAAPIEVSVPWRGHGRSPLHLHHCPALSAEDTALHEGIPVTAVPRTLLDLASSVPPRQLERAVEKTERLGLLDIGQIDQLLERVRGHPGRGKLRKALALHRDPAFSRSRGELRFLELVREAGLPRPLVNCVVEGYELDMYWERERFAVELDGWEGHRSRKAFEDDRERQENLKLAGIEMVRITGLRLAHRPNEIAARLGTLLQRRRNQLRQSSVRSFRRIGEESANAGG